MTIVIRTAKGGGQERWHQRPIDDRLISSRAAFVHLSHPCLSSRCEWPWTLRAAKLVLARAQQEQRNAQKERHFLNILAWSHQKWTGILQGTCPIHPFTHPGSCVFTVETTPGIKAKSNCTHWDDTSTNSHQVWTLRVQNTATRTLRKVWKRNEAFPRS